MRSRAYVQLGRFANLCVLIAVVCSHGCEGRQQRDPTALAPIAGSWKGKQVSWDGKEIKGNPRPFSECLFFTLEPDSSLILSMRFELGPRSRVWMLHSGVSISGDLAQWVDHAAHLTRHRDSMIVTRTESGWKSGWLFVRDRGADSLMSQLRSLEAAAYTYAIPEKRNDGWSCGDLSESGIDRRRIVQLLNEIREGKHDDIHSVLIAKDNKLIVEEYFAARGSRHGGIVTCLFRDKIHHLASTTKAVTSTLVGLAVDHGFITGVDAPIHRYLSAYDALFDEAKKRIRIRDMLTMTPGFEWRQSGVSDNQNDGMQMWRTDDVIRYVLQKPLEAGPGARFNYTNGVPTVTGAIIKNAVGMEVGKFAEKYLFQPLGISEYVWTSYPDGSIETDGGLALRSRDLARVGQLFLNNGVWNGKRIVSEQWVRESTKERLKFGGIFSRWGYGFHWMQSELRVGSRLVHWYFVPGDGNQILAVFPELGMVVVFTAGNYGRDPKPDYFSLFEEFILPAALQER